MFWARPGQTGSSFSTNSVFPSWFVFCLEAAQVRPALVLKQVCCLNLVRFLVRSGSGQGSACFEAACFLFKTWLVCRSQWSGSDECSFVLARVVSVEADFRLVLE